MSIDGAPVARRSEHAIAGEDGAEGWLLGMAALDGGVRDSSPESV